MSGGDAHGIVFIEPFGDGVALETERWPRWALIWYVSMCVIATSSVIMYSIMAVNVRGGLPGSDSDTHTYGRRMRVLAGPVVFSSAFHCFLPTQCTLQYVWWDSPASSLLLSLVLASVADLCLVGQVTSATSFCEAHIFCAKYGTAKPGMLSWHSYTHLATKAMLCGVCLADGFAFAGLITKNYLWFACQEICWGVAMLVMIPTFLYLFNEARDVKEDGGLDNACSSCTCGAQLFGLAMSTLSFMYVPWVFIASAPVYYDAYCQQLEDALTFNDFAQGVQQALTERHVTHDWAIWGPTLPWRTAYFTLASWGSIALVCAPRFQFFPRGSYAPIK